MRAKIVLFAADGWENKDIAARLDTSPQVVHKWRTQWFVRSWISPTRSGLRAKAGRVLDLYEGCFEGEPLGPGEFVIFRG